MIISIRASGYFPKFSTTNIRCLPKQNSLIYQLLEQIHHLCQEGENKTSIIQAPIKKQNNFQNITKGTQEKQEHFL